MPYTEYVGERYVPQFADPEGWNANEAYDPLTIVRGITPDGANALYVSKTYVPPQTSLHASAYWALWSGPAVKGDVGPQGPQGPQGEPGTGATRVAWMRDAQFVNESDPLNDGSTANGAIIWTTAEEPETPMYGGSTRLIIWAHVNYDDGSDRNYLLCSLPMNLFTASWSTTQFALPYDVTLASNLTIKGEPLGPISAPFHRLAATVHRVNRNKHERPKQSANGNTRHEETPPATDSRRGVEGSAYHGTTPEDGLMFVS